MGLQFVDRVLLRERVAHRHDDAALDLPLAGARVDGLADVVRRDDLLDPAGLLVEHAQLRRVAVGHVETGFGTSAPSGSVLARYSP
jgi:hypothetical protein